MKRYGTDQVRYALDEVDAASETDLALASKQADLMVARAQIVKLEIEAHRISIMVASR